MNGVNAGGPLENGGGEKVVGALSVDDSGPMEKHSQSQMAKAKPIIIPFPKGHGPEGRRRNKRDIRRTPLAIGTSLVLIITTGFNATVFFMANHINTVGNGNVSRDFQNTFIATIALAGIFMVLSFVLFIAFLECVICPRRVLTLAHGPPGSAGAGIEMGNVMGQSDV